MKLTKRKSNTIKEFGKDIDNISSLLASKDASTTELLLTIGRSIIDTYEAIEKKNGENKQFYMGKLLYRAKQEVKEGNHNISITELYSGLGVAERTGHEWVKYYLDTEEFKKIISFNTAPKRTLPSPGISRKLQGEDAQQRLDYLDEVSEYTGSEPTVKEVTDYTKKAKTISTKLGCEVYEVNAEDVKDYDQEKVVKQEATQKQKETTFSSLGISERASIRQAYYKEITGWDREDGLKLCAEVETHTAYTKHTEDIFKSIIPIWKDVYRKGSKCFHPDKGGEDIEMVFWKEISNMIETLIENDKAYEVQENFNAEDKIMHDIEEEVLAEWWKENK